MRRKEVLAALFIGFVLAGLIYSIERALHEWDEWRPDE